MTTRTELIESLRWKSFPVLSDGSVCLVDVMGDEQSVINAARVSYGEGTKRTSDDLTLTRYLMRHHHGTPFEMCEVVVRVRAPIFVIRQWHRHRTWSYNEYSGRYSEMIDSMDTTEPNRWRLQDTSNKQGSDGYLPAVGERYYDGTEWDTHNAGKYLTSTEKQLQETCRRVYEERLSMGVAREQARKDLPVSNYTEMYAKTDLRNMLGFLTLRMDSHAQEEIRAYATIIGEQIVKPLFPNVYEAFLDYMLHAVSLSRVDQACCRLLTQYGKCGVDRLYAEDLLRNKASLGFLPEFYAAKRCRERDETLDKLQLIGVVSE